MTENSLWPFGGDAETLSNFINSLVSTNAKDLTTAYNVANTAGDLVGANAYKGLLNLQTSLLSELGLQPGDTVGPAALSELLHTFNSEPALQQQVTVQLQLSLAPLVARTITDASQFGAWLTQATSLVNLVAPVKLP